MHRFWELATLASDTAGGRGGRPESGSCRICSFEHVTHGPVVARCTVFGSWPRSATVEAREFAARDRGGLGVLCLPGDNLDVAARFPRESAPRQKPILNPLRAGIVGRSRKTEIAETISQAA
jgi:hypothetical protein